MLHPRYRTAAITYAAVAVMLFVVTVALPASGAFEFPPLPTAPGVTQEGEVVEILSSSTEQTPGGTIRREEILVRVEGETITINRTFVEGGADAFDLAPGDSVLVSLLEGRAEPHYIIRDRGRRVPLWTLSLAFAALVVLVGGRQGALSLLGLAMAFLVIIRFIVPGILSGGDPLLFAIIGAVVIMTSTLLISHGVNPKTWIAIGGTTASLLITGALAWIAVRAAHLTGIASDDGAALQILTLGTIDARGLLLGGIIIGALGVLDDVTTTQSSTIVELRRANPALGVAQLFRRGMNVGRDHIAATTNTLVLAYSGAALPLLMIIVAQPEPLGIIISFDALATEIVRTLVGSIGIVAAVPVTTTLAAVLVGGGFVSIEEAEADEEQVEAARARLLRDGGHAAVEEREPVEPGPHRR
jgi:uncharacterized membrane protein